MAWRKYKKGYGSSLRRRAKGNFRAAFNQNDSSSIVIKSSVEADMVFDANENEDTYIISMYSVLANSPLYNQFSGFYDQVKIDGIKINLSQTYGSDAFQNANNPLTVVTFFDRNGLNANALGVVLPPTVANASTYSSAIKTTSMVGGTFRQSRYLYPTSSIEKSSYVATGLIGTNDYTDAKQNIAIPWKPVFGLAIKSNNALPAGSLATSVAKFTLEFSIAVTFRGTRHV